MKPFQNLKKKSPFELEKEKRDQKEKEEKAAAAAVYVEYLEDFNKRTSEGSKTFVRGETVLPSVLFNKEDEGALPKGSAGERYTLAAPALMKDDVKSEPPPEDDAKNKKKDGKKKSNLELFKEQLKLEQEQREMRKALKKLREAGTDDPNITAAAAITAAQAAAASAALNGGIPRLLDDEEGPGSYASVGDISTTNIYVGNLDPSINEEYLCKTFGIFGPLASVKVMWPRTTDEKARNRNCGFVAFMTRPDAEKAMAKLNDSTMGEHKVMLGWGKAIPIPPIPVYVYKGNEPAKPTGLPFNAQSKEDRRRDEHRAYGNVAPPNALGGSDDGRAKRDDEIIRDAEVIVTIPDDLDVRRMIHKMVEFVVKEGPPFEAIIMNREYHNPAFRFLVDHSSPEHVYYRWKLYSILQGDKPNSWPSDKFRMYQGGSWWLPPLRKQEGSKDDEPKKGQLKSADRDEFEDMLRSAAMDRDAVRNCMGFALDHCSAAEEIVDVLAQSLSILETPIPTKIARLFIVSDILHNTAVSGASYYRRGFEQQLPTIFKHLNEAYRAISGRMRAEYFKRHVMNVLNAWETWCLYPATYLAELKIAFLTVPTTLIPAVSVCIHRRAFACLILNIIITLQSAQDEDIDGEDLDGEPLDDQQASSSAPPRWKPVAETTSQEAAKRTRIESKWEDDDQGSRKESGDDGSNASKGKKQKIDSKWDADED